MTWWIQSNKVMPNCEDARIHLFIYLFFSEKTHKLKIIVCGKCRNGKQCWKIPPRNLMQPWHVFKAKIGFALANEIDETNELRLAPRVIDNLKTKRLYSPQKKKDIKIKGFRILSLYTWRVILNSGTKILRFSRLQSKKTNLGRQFSQQSMISQLRCKCSIRHPFVDFKLWSKIWNLKQK